MSDTDNDRAASSMGHGTGRAPLPGEPRPGEPDYLERLCRFHGIPYRKLPPEADWDA